MEEGGDGDDGDGDGDGDEDGGEDGGDDGDEADGEAAATAVARAAARAQARPNAAYGSQAARGRRTAHSAQLRNGSPGVREYAGAA